MDLEDADTRKLCQCDLPELAEDCLLLPAQGVLVGGSVAVLEVDRVEVDSEEDFEVATVQIFEEEEEESGIKVEAVLVEEVDMAVGLRMGMEAVQPRLPTLHLALRDEEASVVGMAVLLLMVV